MHEIFINPKILMRRLTTLLKKSIILFLLLTLPYLGISQIKIFKTFAEFITIQNNTKNNLVNLGENKINGSAYLSKDFISGSVITKDNIHYQDIPLRYNIYNDDIEFKTKKDECLAISEPKSLRKIIIGDDTFIYAKKSNKKNARYGYYQLLTTGKIQLLTRHHIAFRDAESPNGISQPRPARFERKSSTFFMKIGENIPLQISKKKDIQSIFGKESKQILAYIKSEKINVRKKTQLIKLVRFINQIN